MGQMIVDKVVQLLSEGGIPAEAAFPGERITRISEIVAAVSLEKADLDDRTAIVLVEIFAPQESGGYACQRKALEACAILEAEGVVCSQGSCEFLSKGHVFRVPVKATFRGTARANNLEALPEVVITMDGRHLQRAVGFAAKQVLGKDDSTLQDSFWEFTLEEFFPWGQMDTVQMTEPFELRLKCMGDVECYEDAVWVGRTRTVEDKGIRQKRIGRAQNRSVTSEK